MPQKPMICVGTDFTSAAAVAVVQAARIATSRGADLHVVHVIDGGRVADLVQGIGLTATEVRQTLQKDSERAWARLSGGHPGLAGTRLHVEFSSRSGGLIRHAKDTSAELLILGAAGDGDADVGIGTIATGCVRSAPCDVLLVRQNQSGPFRRVLVCVDFSPPSDHALLQGARLAALEGAQLNVLHVFSGPTSLLPFLSSFLTQWAEAVTDLEARHTAAIRALCDGFAGEPESVRSVLRSASAHVVESNMHGKTIAQQARKISADVVVVGTRGIGNVHDALLGSTAERVLRDAPSSILAVRPPGQ